MRPKCCRSFWSRGRIGGTHPTMMMIQASVDAQMMREVNASENNKKKLAHVKVLREK